MSFHSIFPYVIAIILILLADLLAHIIVPEPKHPRPPLNKEPIFPSPYDFDGDSIFFNIDDMKEGEIYQFTINGQLLSITKVSDGDNLIELYVDN